MTEPINLLEQRDRRRKEYLKKKAGSEESMKQPISKATYTFVRLLLMWSALFFIIAKYGFWTALAVVALALSLQLLITTRTEPTKQDKEYVDGLKLEIYDLKVLIVSLVDRIESLEKAEKRKVVKKNKLHITKEG